MSEREETSDHVLAMQWAEELLGRPNVFRPWFPKDKFVTAVRTPGSLACTREDKGLFGFGFGSNPEINPAWTHFSLPTSLPREVTNDFPLKGKWSGYSIATQLCADEQPVEELIDTAGVEELLKVHAPDSSTYPGHPEVIFWAGIRSDNGELLAVATVVRWESGAKMISSVATRQDVRGQGLAQRLIKGIVKMSYDRGIDRLNLAVFTENFPARAVYEKVGFECMGDFLYFER
jgi:GNAT superfamily N-acetyltransferase